MKKEQEAVNTPEKERIRAEIDAQVREYLRRGGRICVVSTHVRKDTHVIGGVWRGHFDASLEVW